jgi:PAS domain S-box-containing protein
LPLQAALDEALARILDAAGISLGAVYLTEDGGKLTLQSQLGYNAARLRELQDFFGHSDLLGRALKERQAIKMPSPEIAADITKDLRAKINAQSLLIAPLVVADDPQGVLVAFSSRSELEDDWVGSVKTVTVQLAQAVLLARTLARVSESEQRLRELAENIHGIFYVAGHDGTPIHYVSPAWERITGRNRDDLYRDPMIRLANLHPDDRPRVQQAFQSGAPDLDLEYRIVRPDGETRWLHDRTFPVKDEGGRVVRTVGIAEDVTARKHAEETAQQNLARIRALHEIDRAITSTLKLDTILEVLLDKIGVFLPIAAASTVRLLDSESGELGSLTCRGLDEKAWRSQAPAIPEAGGAQRVVKTKSPVVVADIQKEARSYKSDVFRGLVSYLGVPLIAHDTVLGVLSLYTRREHAFSAEEIDFLDTLAGQAAIAIHNARLYEKMVWANKVKDEFLSVMSHELRTPLTIVMGYTGLVKEGTLGKINRRQKEALDKVLVRAGDQLELINEIMQTTQLEARAVSPHIEYFNLRDLLDQLRADYTVRAVKKTICLKWDYPSASIPITSDGLKLKQILYNLINNALKFTDSGTVEVTARLAQGERREATGARHSREEKSETHASRLTPVLSGVEGPHAYGDGFVEFQVRDTGIGISKEMQGAIFNKFSQADGSETRSYGGVGLGLYVVKQYTDLLGGKIEIQSEPGKGSAFTVRIPCARGVERVQ